eukprot:PhF_6_TR35775/c0_g1_i1/m.51986
MLKDWIGSKPLPNQPTVVNITAKGLSELGYKRITNAQYDLAYQWSQDPQHLMIMRAPLQMMKRDCLGKHQLPFGFWGNPFKLESESNRVACVTKFYQHAKQNKEMMARLSELSGKHIGCVCAPKLCHGHALVRLWREQHLAVEEPPIEKKRK